MHQPKVTSSISELGLLTIWYAANMKNKLHFK